MGREKTVIIVGAGMAGLAAADLLSAHGVDLLILDENPHTGGQFLRPRATRHGRLGLPAPDRTREAGMRIAARLRERKVPVLHGTRVLGVFPERRLWAADSRDRILELRQAFLILAPNPKRVGADRCVRTDFDRPCRCQRFSQHTRVNKTQVWRFTILFLIIICCLGYLAGQIQLRGIVEP